MSIEYESLKKKYFELFDGKLEYFDFIITDVLFAYKEISEIVTVHGMYMSIQGKG